MSRKIRIIISCILILVAFGAGFVIYAQTYGDRPEEAVAEGTPKSYLIDKDGHIEEPVGGNTEEARKTRGTETNPFFILEIVPYDGMAEFGYLISGKEPIDVEALARNNEHVPGKTDYYKVTDDSVTFTYWKKDKPDTFKGTKLTTEQYGTMTYLPDEGNYNRIETVEGGVTVVTYDPATNGDYKWQPLSITECLAIKADEDAKSAYKPSTELQTVEEGGSYLMYFSDMEYYTGTGYTLEHKDAFLRESVGLAYEIKDGVRDYLRTPEGAIDEVRINNLVDNYHTELYTVTPEDLNRNSHLVDRADLIVISARAKMGAELRTYVDKDDTLEDGDGNVKSEYKYIPYLRKGMFGYEDEWNVTNGRGNNIEGATFDTNLLNWDVALKIYGRATDPARICPIVTDVETYSKTKGKSGGPFSAEVELTKRFASGTTIKDSKRWGTQNNMTKLYLMMYQMTNPVFEAFYGEPTSASNVLFGSTEMKDASGNPIVRKGVALQTGEFRYDANWPSGESAEDDESKVYWTDLTLYPWAIMPYTGSGDNRHTNVGEYGKYAAMYGIMVESGPSGNDMTSGDAQNSIRNGLFQYFGANNLSYDFNKEGSSQVKNGEYGGEVYEYFDSINGTDPAPTELSSAECLYYLLNGLKVVEEQQQKQYKILELQASPIYENEELFWKPLIAAYANSGKDPIVEHMTTSEFIGSHVECISDFDLVYVGMNKSADDVTMKFTSGTNFVYAHTGPKITVNAPFRALYGWLGRGLTEIGNEPERLEREKTFAYSGNDLTKAALKKLQDFDTAGLPILFSTGFYTDAAPKDVAATVDRNSNVYILGTAAVNKFDIDDLPSDVSERTRFRNVLTVYSQKVEMVDVEKPIIYNSANPEADRYINGWDSNRTLRFKFTVKAPAGTYYEAKLYVDSNTDGIYKAGQEDINAQVYRINESGYEEPWSGSLEAGKTYVVKRTITDRVGSVCWKLDLVRDSKVYSSLSGVSAIQAKTAADVKTIKVLQIVPKAAKQSVTLPMTEAEANALGNASEMFYDKIQGINGLIINFVQMEEADIVTEIVGTGTLLAPSNPDYLYENYDMLVLGFADVYDGVSQDLVLTGIEKFIEYGKAVLYTHDTSSGIGSLPDIPEFEEDKTAFPVWGTVVTRRYRDLFGMDRYGAKGYLDGVDMNSEAMQKKDMPYTPLSGTTNYSDVYKNSTDIILRQGVANGMLYRTYYPSQTWAAFPDPHDANVNTMKVSRVNQGAITEYPYTIPETIKVATTHPQYYQLDMENEEMVVWYCLADDDTALDYERAYFKNTPNDVRNNYYIYNVGNVTYSGMGHIPWFTTELKMYDDETEEKLLEFQKEIELFVNTFVAAYRASAQPVTAEIVNDDVTYETGTGEYYIPVDVDSSEPDEIIGADIVETYQLQVPNASADGYVEDAVVTKRSKRVYFKLVDSNSYGGTEYDLTLVLNDGATLDGVRVNGTDERFAVYEAGTDTYVDTKHVKFVADKVYYVDVPIHITTVGGKRTVGMTALKIDVRMNYSIGSKSFHVNGQTKVNISPRGFFNLD